MTMGVFDFKAIHRKLDRLEQKAEFEEKNPKPVEAAPVVWTPEWGYGVAPYGDANQAIPIGPENYKIFLEALNGADGGACGSAGRLTDPGHTHSWTSSLAHPEWPYTGTPHEWPKFKI